MKLGTLIAGEKVLEELRHDLELDGITAYRFSQFIHEVRDKLRGFTDVRNAFIKDHSEDGKLEPGRDDDAISEFQALYTEMINEEVDITVEPILKLEFFTKVTSETMMIVEMLGLLEVPVPDIPLPEKEEST